MLINFKAGIYYIGKTFASLVSQGRSVSPCSRLTALEPNSTTRTCCQYVGNTTKGHYANRLYIDVVQLEKSHKLQNLGGFAPTILCINWRLDLPFYVVCGGRPLQSFDDVAAQDLICRHSLRQTDERYG